MYCNAIATVVTNDSAQSIIIVVILEMSLFHLTL